MDSRFPLAACVVMGLLAVLPAASARATPALTSRPVEMWIRTFDGDVVYLAENDARLSALCIQSGKTARWLPSAVLDDIRHPKIDDVSIVRGVGFSDIDQHVPDWGAWGVSVEIPSLAEEKETLVDGPTYFFVIHEWFPVFRVERRPLPSTDDPRISQSTEIWLPVPSASLRDAPCQSPQNVSD